MTAESAFDFFNQLGAQAGVPKAPPQAVEEHKQPEVHTTATTTETVSRNANWDEGLEGTIKRSLLIGNLEHAAEVCLKAGRTTEALLIAEAGGEALFNKIKEDYFANYCKDGFVKLQLRSIVNDDFSELVPALKNWKEALAYLLAYVEEPRERQTQVHELAEELLTKRKDINSAIACYLLAEADETVVDLWKKRVLYLMKKGHDRTECLFHLFEKCVLLRAVTKRAAPLRDFDLALTDVAEFLAGEDMSDLALKFLDAFGNSQQSNVALIKDRVFNSDSTKKNAQRRPQFPYQLEKVKIHMSQYTRAVDPRHKPAK